MRMAISSAAVVLLGAVTLLAACQPADSGTAEEGESAVEELQTQSTPEKEEPMTEAPPTAGLSATMKTSKGDIHLVLHSEKTPLTVANFINLAQRGYYDGLTFHRVLANFMIQGGCPLGTGTGGPGYNFKDEFDPELKHDRPGILSMANSGPGTNGSQFFVTHVPTPWLDGKHSIFGSIVGPEDQEVVNAIAQGDTLETIEIHGDPASLFEEMKSQLERWNAILDK